MGSVAAVVRRRRASARSGLWRRARRRNSMSDFTTPAPQVPRDRWQRPLVVPPKGGKPVAYTRCTTFVGCLEDTFNLSRWQQRMVALGLNDRPDLLLAVAAHR